MNILTFDIEEWYDYRRLEKCAEFDRYLDAILEKLDERSIKATFFCVGEMGRLFPEVLRKIHSHGHEIGCHSNTHTWLNKMSEQDCREDTHRAIANLEECVGEKVLSYRAPAFSIGSTNKWSFEILAEEGIERDTSIFPAERDFGGFPNFECEGPCVVDYNGIRIKEFPISTTRILGQEVAYSGGGYFRLFPLRFVKKEIENNEYAICYFHIGDLIPESHRVMNREEYESYFKEPGTLKARYMRYFKSNLGKKTAFEKMFKLIDCLSFVGLGEADKIIDWQKVPVVNINNI